MFTVIFMMFFAAARVAEKVKVPRNSGLKNT